LTSPSEQRKRAEIYAAYGLTCPPRYATLRNFDNPTFGPKVARVAEQLLGSGLMPWQRYVLDTGLEVHPGTRIPVYRKVGVTVERQHGKTMLSLPLSCWRGMSLPMQHIMYGAQTGVAAEQKFEEDQVPMLERAGWVPEQDVPLRPEHRAKVVRRNGHKGLNWVRTKSFYRLQSSTGTSGHGKVLHLGLADEFFAQVDYRIPQAWSPAQITVPDAQMWWFSTAGTKASVPYNSEVKRGRELVEAGGPTASAFFEWSRPRDADRADRQVWLDTMPALCPDPVCRCSPTWRHTITLSVLAAELEAADTPAKLADFDRAYGNIPTEDDDPAQDPNVPTIETWLELGDPDLEGTGGAAVAIGVDVTPKGDHAAILAVGEGPMGPAGPPLVTVLEHGPGTEWVVPYVVRFREALKPVAVALDPTGRARELVTPLINAGVKPAEKGKDHARGDLWLLTASDVGAASARFGGMVERGELRHLRQRPLGAAVPGLRTRPIGDGLFAYGRKASSVDVCPWMAAVITMAAFERFRALAVSTDYDLLDSIG